MTGKSVLVTTIPASFRVTYVSVTSKKSKIQLVGIETFFFHKFAFLYIRTARQFMSKCKA